MTPWCDTMPRGWQGCTTGPVPVARRAAGREDDARASGLMLDGPDVEADRAVGVDAAGTMAGGSKSWGVRNRLHGQPARWCGAWVCRGRRRGSVIPGRIRAAQEAFQKGAAAAVNAARATDTRDGA